MRIALLDNGSLEPAAHRSLRAAAAALTARTGLVVEAVSWKHSDRIAAGRARRRAGLDPRCPGCAPGSARASGSSSSCPSSSARRGRSARRCGRTSRPLRAESGGFAFAFTEGLAPAEETLAEIVAARVRETAAAGGLSRPAVIVVDHGGPARASAALRDAVAAAVRARLGDEAAGVAAASMESPPGPDYAFNEPLLAQQLGAPGFQGDIVIAPLFLGPGRHAGAGGDLAEIARAAEAQTPGLRCHFTDLVGSHPLAIAALGRNLRALVPDPAVL